MREGQRHPYELARPLPSCSMHGGVPRYGMKDGGAMVRLVGHFLALRVVSAFCTTALASDGKDALLHLPLRPPVENTRQLPLTSALSNLGSRVQGGYVIFGVEVLLKMGKEPNLTISDKQGSDLGMALDDIMRQLPNYEM